MRDAAMVAAKSLPDACSRLCSRRPLPRLPMAHSNSGEILDAELARVAAAADAPKSGLTSCRFK